MRFRNLFLKFWSSIKNIISYINKQSFNIIKHIFRPVLLIFRFDFLIVIYYYSVFFVIYYLKKNYINEFSFKLTSSGYIKSFQLLDLKNYEVYLYILATISLIILSNSKYRNISAFRKSVTAYICFNILGIFVLITDQFEILTSLFFLLYGGLVSIIIGLRNLSYEPKWMAKKGLKNKIKIELIKLGISKWWRGLTILTSILIALFVTALVSWVLAPTPADLKTFEDFTVKLSFYLFITALPGLIYIYIRALKQINYFENLLVKMV